MTARNKYSGLFEDTPSSPSKKGVTRRVSSVPPRNYQPPSQDSGLNSHDRATRTRKFKKVKSKVGFINSIQKKRLAAVILVIVAVGLIYQFGFSSKDSPSVVATQESSEKELPKEKPAFELVYPAGRQEEAYDVVRSNPEGKATSYTYLDWFSDGGPIFRVTQQQIPKDFDLAEVAQGFQATDVIQVDETIVYHGYSEKGGIQYLVFEKNGLLILIRSQQRFTDDTWASYVASMQ